MIVARLQPFCRKYDINIGCFNGKKITARTFIEIKKALFIHNNHFCLLWESQNIIYNQAIKEELKPNFRVVDNVISDKLVTGFIKYEYKRKKVQPPLISIILHYLETLNKIRLVQYCSCIYKLSKLSGKYYRDRDKSGKEYQKSLNDCVVFDGGDCINEIIDHVLSFKGEAKIITKYVEFNLPLIADNGSGFDSYVVLNILPL